MALLAVVDPAAEPPMDAAAAYRETARRILEGQAAHALAAAHLYGKGMAHAPDVAAMQAVVLQMDEKLEQYERLRELYGAETGEDVRERVDRHLRRLPLAGSWHELAVLEVVLGAARLLQLRSLRCSSFEPLADAAERFLAVEERRDGFGIRVLVRAAHRAARPLTLQRHFDRWFPAALRSLGRPGSAGNTVAVSTRLKARDSGAVMRELADRLRPLMRYVGLGFPPRRAMDVELPPELDLAS